MIINKIDIYKKKNYLAKCIKFYFIISRLMKNSCEKLNVNFITECNEEWYIKLFSYLLFVSMEISVLMEHNYK